MRSDTGFCMAEGSTPGAVSQQCISPSLPFSILCRVFTAIAKKYKVNLLNNAPLAVLPSALQPDEKAKKKAHDQRY